MLEIGEIWGHDFTIETCCLASYEQVVSEMAADPEWATELLRQLGAEVFTGHRLRRLYDGHCNPPVLDFRLTIEPVSFADMRAFVRRYHVHCDPPVTWRFGAAILNGGTRIGVVSVGNPVAKGFMGRNWVEVNRLCVRRDLAPQLSWNACSQLYGFAAKEAARRGFAKIITYTRIDEPGTSLKAAGWTREGRCRGHGWNSRRRPRSNRNGWIDKFRWSRLLQPSRGSTAPRPKTRADPWLTVEPDALGLGISRITILD